MNEAQNLLTAEDAAKFDQDGYFIFESGISYAVLKKATNDFRPYWAGKESTGVYYADSGRVQDGWGISSACFKIATAPRILAVLRQLYGREAMPFQTLNFPVGTEQRAHSDAIHFNCEPFGLMCGVWVALEDVGADQGPLIYYPGSHKLPETNFRDIGIDADPKNYSQYEDFVGQQVAKYRLTPAYGIIKKGQALVWAANLLHGGSAREDKTKSRHSQVTHYYLAGAKPWRPMSSKSERVYFEPDWITAEKAYQRSWAMRRQRIKQVIKKLLGRT